MSVVTLLRHQLDLDPDVRADRRKLATIIEVTTQTVDNWYTKKNEPRATDLLNFAEAIVAYRTRTLIRPLVEYAKIQPQRSGRGWSFGTSTLDKDLKHALLKKSGIYLFYSSAGTVVYVGKTDTNLYLEAKQRLRAKLNRPVREPTKVPDPRAGDIAAFISAYEVTVPAAVKNVESFLLRAFANSIYNRNSGEFLPREPGS